MHRRASTSKQFLRRQRRSATDHAHNPTLCILTRKSQKLVDSHLACQVVVGFIQLNIYPPMVSLTSSFVNKKFDPKQLDMMAYILGIPVTYTHLAFSFVCSKPHHTKILPKDPDDCFWYRASHRQPISPSCVAFVQKDRQQAVVFGNQT